jgi:hypothetical protein
MEECECVRRLLAILAPQAADIRPQSPPAPDVLVIFADKSRAAFEVTQIHPDEVRGQGSAMRTAEERRAKHDPSASVLSWVPTNAMPSIRIRVEEKVKKAAHYAVQPNETLSLLLVGSIPKIGAIAATTIILPFLSVDQLNTELHEVLGKSRFQHAYLHLPLAGNAVWGWDGAQGWRVLRDADDNSREGREILQQLRSQGGFGPDGLLPGTQITGWRR